MNPWMEEFFFSVNSVSQIYTSIVSLLSPALLAFTRREGSEAPWWKGAVLSAFKAVVFVISRMCG